MIWSFAHVRQSIMFGVCKPSLASPALCSRSEQSTINMLPKFRKRPHPTPEFKALNIRCRATKVWSLLYDSYRKRNLRDLFLLLFYGFSDLPQAA